MGNSSYKPFILKTDIELQEIVLSSFVATTCSMSLLREDQIHPFVSGNKFRKLKYNIEQAVKDGHKTLLTFGGAYSNHIAAVAAAGNITGLKTIGVIRGEELSDKIPENPTLSFAQEQGMQLHFVTRKAYRDKYEASQMEALKKSFGNFYLLPEGGTNDLAIKGCEEILSEIENSDTFDYVCAPVGTGGTIAGLIEGSKPNQKVLGFSALKGNFQISEVKKYTSKTNFEITDKYCFEGYAKIDLQLVRFINDFYKKTGIPLDPVYTGKMLFGIVDLLKRGYFKKNSRIFAVHTGGLQGIPGMNQRLKKKNLPQIII